MPGLRTATAIAALLSATVVDVSAIALAQEEDASGADINTTDFHGLRVRDDNALIELGAEADVKFVRTGDAKLSVVLDEYHVHGEFHADSVYVDGVNVLDLCNCSESNKNVPVDLEITTGTSLYSDTEFATFVEFYIPGQMWTPPYRFSRGSIPNGDKRTESYVLSGEPTKLRLSTGEIGRAHV